jgi:hypothetical protein
MNPTESRMITCQTCRRWKVFVRPEVIAFEQPVLQVKPCDCGKPLTMIWKPPTRFTLLEVD